MTLRAGFAEIDITPPVGTLKVGWLIRIVSDTLLDPLYARAAVIDSGEAAIGIISLDTVSIRWTQANEFRRRIKERFGFDGANVMVAATHNHAGPAIANVGDVPRDDAYLKVLTEKVVDVFGKALENRREAQLGFGWGFEFSVAHNRRLIMRDGTVKTHGTFDDPAALCFEGPIDPEVAVLAARTPAGEPLGAIVNFACHPTHHGGTKELSAGYPGALVNELKARGWPVAMFLNGACGNMHHNNPADHGRSPTKEQIGVKLADDAVAIIKDMKFRGQARLWSASQTIDLPFRRYSKEEVAGTVRGAQRFVDPAAYDRGMDALIRRINARKVQKAQVQVLGIDEIAIAGIPAEYFVELGLKIKELGRPAHMLVVSHANGMIGYVPHAAAFIRGGYETTFAGSSKLAPEAGDMLVDCAIGLIRKGAET